MAYLFNPNISNMGNPRIRWGESQLEFNLGNYLSDTLYNKHYKTSDFGNASFMDKSYSTLVYVLTTESSPKTEIVINHPTANLKIVIADIYLELTKNSVAGGNLYYKGDLSIEFTQDKYCVIKLPSGSGEFNPGALQYRCSRSHRIESRSFQTVLHYTGPSATETFNNRNPLAFDYDLTYGGRTHESVTLTSSYLLTLHSKNKRRFKSSKSCTNVASCAGISLTYSKGNDSVSLSFDALIRTIKKKTKDGVTYSGLDSSGNYVGYKFKSESERNILQELFSNYEGISSTAVSGTLRPYLGKNSNQEFSVYYNPFNESKYKSPTENIVDNVGHETTISKDDDSAKPSWYN